VDQSGVIQAAVHLDTLERRSLARCQSCGAPLNPGFYFCVCCATPYKSQDTVLPIVRPPDPTIEMLVQRKAPNVLPLFWTYLGVVIGVAILNTFLSLTGHEELALVIGSAAMFITTCIFAAWHWPALAVQFKRFGFFHWEAWAGLAALAPLLGINFLWHGWLRDRMPELHYGWSALVLFICVLPAVLEETAFRGLVQHWLQVAVKPFYAIVIAAALFTALHLSIYSAPYLFAVGALLGWVKWKTGSLYPSMLIHFLHNLAVIAFLWNGG
jgi:membrane protease YdiL (CAAX protease family)